MKKIILTLYLFFIFASPCLASRASDVKKGNQNYFKEQYPEAEEYYQKALNKDSDSDIVNFNMGGAFYQQGEYKKAQDHLQKVLLTENKELKDKVLYNLGNNYYRDGISKEKDDLPFAIQSLEESLSSYEKVFMNNPKDEDATHNYEFVKKELERLKKNAENQENKTCPRPKDKQDQKDKENQESQQNQDQKQDQGQDNQKKDSEKQKDEQKQEQKDKQSQQEQKDRQGQSEKEEQQQQDPKDQNQEQSSEKQKRGQKPQPQGQSSCKAGQQPKMTEKEAKMFLSSYEQTEEPKGFLNLNPQKPTISSVEKDW